ncbi:MAG: MFS transporter [Deltaproteobacteria bacterium]|nr:MFS transporter [Deltaproteobacteria bacterium]
MNSTPPLAPSRTTLLRVFIPFAIGYFFSYLYRVVNAVIAPNLVADLGLNPGDLGLLTSTYFLTFAAFQLPLGVLLDRFGSRKTEASLLLFAAVGAFIFATADSVPGLIIGRALIGFGVSSCLMGAFTAFVIWFPKERLPLVNGIQVAVGGLGALTGTMPVEAALQITDWRMVFTLLAVLTLGVAVAIFFIVPERRAEGSGATLKEQVRGIGTVYKSPVFWRIAPWSVTSQATFMAIQTLWAGPWLRDVAGYGRMAMARGLLLIAASMVVGFVLIGALAARLSRSGIKPLYVSVSGMGVFMVIQGLIILHILSLALPLWILFGFFGAAGVLNYAILCQSFPGNLAGRVNTGLNVMVFVVAFGGQWGIGEIINLWPVLQDGRYAPAGYQAGFGLMLGMQVLSVIWFILAGKRMRQHTLL